MYPKSDGSFSYCGANYKYNCRIYYNTDQNGKHDLLTVKVKAFQKKIWNDDEFATAVIIKDDDLEKNMLKIGDYPKNLSLKEKIVWLAASGCKPSYKPDSKKIMFEKKWFFTSVTNYIRCRTEVLDVLTLVPIIGVIWVGIKIDNIVHCDYDKIEWDQCKYNDVALSILNSTNNAAKVLTAQPTIKTISSSESNPNISISSKVRNDSPEATVTSVDDSESSESAPSNQTPIIFPIDSLTALFKFVTDIKVSDLVAEVKENLNNSKKTFWSRCALYVTGYDESSPEGMLIEANTSFDLIKSLFFRKAEKRGASELYQFIKYIRSEQPSEDDLKNAGEFGTAMLSIIQLQSYLSAFYKSDNTLDMEKLVLNLIQDKELIDFLNVEENIIVLVDLFKSLDIPNFSQDEKIRVVINLILDWQKLIFKYSAGKFVHSSAELAGYVQNFLSEDLDECCEKGKGFFELIQKLKPLIEIFISPNPYPLECLLNSDEKPKKLYKSTNTQESYFYNCHDAFTKYKESSLGVFGPLYNVEPLRKAINSKVLDGFIFFGTHIIESLLTSKHINTNFELCAFEDFSFAKTQFHNFNFKGTYFKHCNFSESIFKGEIYFEDASMDQETFDSIHVALTSSKLSSDNNLTISKKSNISIISDESEAKIINIYELIENKNNSSVENKNVENKNDTAVVESDDEFHSLSSDSSDEEPEITKNDLPKDLPADSYAAKAANAVYSAAGMFFAPVEYIKDGVKYYSGYSVSNAEDVKANNSKESEDCSYADMEIQNFKIAMEKELTALKSSMNTLYKNGSTDSTQINDLKEKISKQKKKLDEIECILEKTHSQRLEKERIAAEHTYLLKTKNSQLKLYYQTLLSNISSFFQTIALVNNEFSLLSAQRGKATKLSNRVEKDFSITGKKAQEEKLNSLWNKLCNAGDYVVELVDTLKPVLNLVTGDDIPTPFGKGISISSIINIINNGINIVTDANDQNKFANTNEAFNGLTPKKLEKIADEIARKISLSYEEQIRLLSNEGAKGFAQYACSCIFGALLNGLMTDQDEIITESWLAMRRLKTSHNRVVPLFNLPIPFTVQSLPGSEKDKSFEARNLYLNSGIAVVDGDKFNRCTLAPNEKAEFGYFRISNEELKKHFPSYQVITSLTLSCSKKTKEPTLEGKRVKELGVKNPSSSSNPEVSKSHIASNPHVQADEFMQLKREFDDAGKKYELKKASAEKEYELEKASIIDRMNSMQKIIAAGFSSNEPVIVSPKTTPKPRVSPSKAPIDITPKDALSLSDGPVGLDKITNSCYMNAVLQVILRIPYACETILKNTYDFDGIGRTKAEIEDEPKKIPIRNALLDLVKSDKMNRQAKLIQLRKESFQSGYLKGHILAQNDAEEFLNCILNSLNWETFYTTDRVIPLSPSYIKPYSIYIDTNRLSMAIPNIESIKFEDIITNHFSEQTSYDPRVHNNASISEWKGKSTIVRSPEILFIHLKRFERSDDKTTKIETKVQFPEDELISIPSEDGDCIYKIISIINHQGTFNGGHYTAHVKHNDKWHLCDDLNIFKDEPLGKPSKCSSDPYIIVLEKCKK